VPTRITYVNGAVEEVERCLVLETKKEDGTWTTPRWIVQRHKMVPVLIKDEEIRRVENLVDGLPQTWTRPL